MIPSRIVFPTAAVASVGLRTPETNAERDTLVSRMDYNQDGKVDKVTTLSPASPAV